MTDHRGTDWVFSNLSKGEAEEYFRRYVDESEERVAAFIESVAARGGPPLDFGEESMARLGACLMDELEEGPRESLPLWAQQPMGDGFPGRVSGDGLWLLDGAARYFAEALCRHHPHLRWMLNRNKIDTLFQQPMLVGFGASGMGRVAPIMPIMRVFTERSRDEPDEGWLGRSFSYWSHKAVEAEGSVSEEEPPMPIDEVEVTPVVGDPDWDAEIWVPEWAEAVLGERVFGELAGRLSGIEGVVDLAWEDRERFLVRLAAGVDLKRLEADVAAVMRAAEADAEGE